MPYLMSTPEKWFRTQKRDLHLMSLSNSAQIFLKKLEPAHSEKKCRSEKTQLRAWFSQNLPHVSIGVIGASEYSGWIEGGPRYFSVDLTAREIAICNEAWGEDSFWEIETWYFSDWLKRIESIELLTSPTPDMQIMLWWDTPKGILLLDAHTQGIFVGEESGEKRLTLRDGWWRLQQLFPEFTNLAADVFPCGYFYPDQDKTKTSLIVVEYSSDLFDKAVGWNSDEYSKNDQKIQLLKIAMGIPEAWPIEIINGDF